MLDQLLGAAKDGVVKDLAAKLGLSGGDAGGFLQKALSLLEGALKSGKLDVSSLLGGNVSGVLSKLDLSSLGGLVGGDEGKARTGMGSVLTALMNGAKGDANAGAILGQLTGGAGGVMGQVSGLAGKIFGKS